jgi:NSS family neurotransmitter:Na+ symporter
MPKLSAAPDWSSQFATYVATIGAAVGLGSIWRFPYLAGKYGGGVFIGVFVFACLFIAAPLLVAEFMIGRYAKRPPLDAAGAMAQSVGGSRRWNIIGALGTSASFVICSYYSIIAGWIIAYTLKCARGTLTGLPRAALHDEWQNFLSRPGLLMAWQVLFLGAVAFISARGVGRGIELASRIRAPALLVLLLLLDAYALATGNVGEAMRFAFAPHWSAVSGELVLAAIGQAFYATGVGAAVMLAYGAYMSRGTPLVRPALIITASILLVSLLATLLVFPLVFRFHMDPAAGATLVFEVLPAAFAIMPGGRLIGTAFFLLLILAALTPSLAMFEPLVAWLQARAVKRGRAVLITAVALWIAGIGSVLSFNVLAQWHPFAHVPVLAGKTVFELADFVAGDILLPLGALFSCLLVGWRLDAHRFAAEIGGNTARVWRVCRFMLRYLCPAAILAVLLAAFLPGQS